MDSDWKPGGTRIVSFGSVSGRIKKWGFDSMGQWTYQLFQGGDNVHLVIFSIYNCCKTPSNKKVTKTAHYQQELMLSYLNQSGTPWWYFKQDLMLEIYQLRNKYGSSLQVWILGDWNKDYHHSSIGNNLCEEFGLINIFDELHPELKDFKTFIKGSNIIDYALSVWLRIESVIPKTVYYEAFFHQYKGDHQAIVLDIPTNFFWYLH